MRLLLLFLSFSCFFVLTEQLARFDGDRVFRIFPEETHDLRLLKELRELQFDFWTETIISTKPLDIRVPSALIPTFIATIKKFNVKFEVMIDNVQHLVEEQKKQHAPLNELPSLLDEAFYSSYHTYDEVVSWLQQLVAANPNLTELINVGKSYEGRIQWAVKVSTSQANKTALWFDGGLHAREWISTGAVIYMLGHIVSDHASDPDVQALLAEFDVLRDAGIKP
eukprot:TRINITY_DN1685_c0_g1_i1.p2 TRINITY_DN1685_c0_g1~~TRINITY_DN1685_c0_g1_i1.p2  ORF type:complete len:224 (-),score=49.82 TRINITY_DN1685_c0_g1_i1:712-1383(-)